MSSLTSISASLRDRIARSDYAKFLLYRLGRLYPVHILTMVVMLIFFAVASHVAVRPAVAEHFDATTVIANIFLLQGWWTVLGSPNGPAWTVSSEWLIYMCWPVLVFVTVRLTKDMRLVAMAVLFGMVFLIPNWASSRATNLWPSPGLEILVEFSIGMLLYTAKTDYALVDRLPRVFSLVSVAGFLAALYLLNKPGPWVILSFLCMVLGLSNDRDYLAQRCSRPWLLYLGEISYSIYMVHWVIWTPWKYGFPIVFPHIDIMTPWFMVPPFIATLVAAAAMYHFVELPARARVRRWTDRRVGLLSRAV